MLFLISASAPKNPYQSGSNTYTYSKLRSAFFEFESEENVNSSKKMIVHIETSDIWKTVSVLTVFEHQASSM